MTVTGQSQVLYAYDDAHHLTSITQATSTVGFSYDDAGRRSTLTYPNGIVGTYGYDDANQLTSLAYVNGQTTVGDLTYTYDAAGSRINTGGSWARTGLPASVASATYDVANRTQTWNGANFNYDLNGNLTSDGTNNYGWNARDQLAAITRATSASFAYDSLNRRRSKAINGTTTQFLYDGENVAQEQSAGGTPLANLVTGLSPDQTFVRTDGSGASALLMDALGSALALADASGAVQTQYRFGPFGTTTSSGATNSNTLQFTGRENDGASLYFYRARYWSPQLYKFLSEDPVEFGGNTVNLYEYAFNNPMSFTDPSGNQPLFPSFPLLEDPIVIDPELLEQAQQAAAPETSLEMPNGGKLDLSGRGHFDKSIGRRIPTPHVHEPQSPFDPPYQNIPRGLKRVPRPATPDDLLDALRHLRQKTPAIPFPWDPFPGRKMWS